MGLGTVRCVQKPLGTVLVGGFIPQMQIWTLGRGPNSLSHLCCLCGGGFSSLHPVSVTYPGWIRWTDLRGLTQEGRWPA